MVRILTVYTFVCVILATLTGAWFELHLSTTTPILPPFTHSLAVLTRHGRAHVPCTAPIPLRSVIGVKVRNATIFAVRWTGGTTDWIQFNFILPPIKGLLGTAPRSNIGTYVTGSFLGNKRVGLALNAPFLHSKGCTSKGKGGLAIRVYRDATIEYPQTRQGWWSACTYSDVDFHPESTAFDFNSGFDITKEYYEPGQTIWVSESLPWIPPVLTQWSSVNVALATDGTLSYVV